MKRIFVLLIGLLSVLSMQAQVSVTDLRCEMLVNPLGIDVTQPRLSWQINSNQRNVQQQSYQLIVASSVEKLNQNIGDLWNSGTISSGQSVHVVYNGKTLQSKTTCYWKVKIVTNKGTSEWSKPAYFNIGLLNKDDWKGKWIGYDKASAWDSMVMHARLSARYLRKEFTSAQTIKSAKVYIVGLGLYELFINGKKVGNNILTPSPTDYRKTVQYNTYDVTTMLRTGKNAVAATLGNGRFFNMRQNFKTDRLLNFGFPKMLLQLEIEYANGSKQIIVTDESWKLNVDGPVRTANEYDGEEYDATKELTGWNNINYNDSKWLTPEIVKAPDGVLRAQMNEPMRVMKTIKPLSIKKTGASTYILDMGQNFAGWLQLKVKGKAGTKVTMRFAESIQPNDSLYTANLRSAYQTNIYTLKGTGVEVWHPSFIYNGFRFVEITGYPGVPTVNDFEGMVVYDGFATTGSLQTSDTIINKVLKNAWWGISSNYKGMPVDCPQRDERQPWLGDHAIGCYGESFLFDNAKLYAKWLNDMQDAQTEEGTIPDIVPAYKKYYTDNVTWPGTYLTVTDMLYRQFGDAASVVKHYPSMRKWMKMMETKYMKNYLISRDSYGDWCVPPESLELIHAKDSMLNTDGELIASSYYYYLLRLMQKFAKISHNEQDVNEYAALAVNVKQAFNNKFYNASKKYYANNSITSNLLPLYFDMVDNANKEAVFNNIYTKIRIEKNMHISTGVIGTQWLMRTLTKFQHPDISFTLASNKTYPSWGYMAESGATTIWELWNGNTANPWMNSQNHVMILGDLLIWLYEHVAGIKSDETEVGFKKIIMKPENIDGLNFASASYNTLYGTIKSSWKKTNQQFIWDITIPANSSAVVYIPASSGEDVMENNLTAAKANGIKSIGMEGRAAVFEVGSGSYHFVSTFKFREGVVTDEFIFNRASFPESHASTIAETPDGLIAAWFGGTKEGYSDVCLWTSRLVKGKWTVPEKVADGVMNDSVRYACYNPVLFYAPNGELLLFYKIGPNVAGWTGWMMRSKDNGRTWSKREALPEGFLGPIKNKPEFINGVLLCPSSTEKTGWKAHIEFTTDYGKTWSKTEAINDPKILQAIQPSILKYTDGRLQILCRSRNTTINESWSSDGGKTWSEMKASALPNNNSGTDAVTLKDGRHLLVYNHTLPNDSWVKGKGPRTPLNVAISNDGKKWYAAVVLEDSPISQYSYPSVIQTKDGMVHIVYTWRRERIKHVVLDPAKLELKEIVNQQWPGVVQAEGKTTDD